MIEVPRDLIEQAASGDETAFEEIYKLTSDYVYTVAYRVTGNIEDAQEVTQDVFVSIYRNLWKFKFRSSMKTWIYRITVNKAINYYNRNKKKKKHETPDEAAMRYKGTQPDIYASMNREDGQKKISLMMKTLNPDQRACLMLRAVEGLSYEEIAETLKININTVRTRLKRGREKLLQYVNGEAGNELC